MANMEDFRAEFDDLIQQYKTCEMEQQRDESTDEDFPDYIVELKAKMLSPQKSGLYFSKKEIREISQKCGESISLKQRERMISDLLRSIFDLDEMKKVFDVIKGHIDLKISYYEELSSAFDTTSHIFLDLYKPKALALRKSLDRILAESGGQVLK